MFSFIHNGANKNLSNTKRDFTSIERIEELQEHSIDKAPTAKDPWLEAWAGKEEQMRAITPEIADKINKINNVIKVITLVVSSKSQDEINAALREALYKLALLKKKV
jgi:hypothetical protein